MNATHGPPFLIPKSDDHDSSLITSSQYVISTVPDARALRHQSSGTPEGATAHAEPHHSWGKGCHRDVHDPCFGPAYSGLASIIVYSSHEYKGAHLHDAGSSCLSTTIISATFVPRNNRNSGALDRRSIAAGTCENSHIEDVAHDADRINASDSRLRVSMLTR